MGNIPEEVRKIFAEWGAKGGKAGMGEKKKRGDTEYYKGLAAKATKARKRKPKAEKRNSGQ